MLGKDFLNEKLVLIIENSNVTVYEALYTLLYKSEALDVRQNPLAYSPWG